MSELVKSLLEKDPLTEKVIGAAIEVHRHLGRGLLESVYEEALAVEFELRSISYKRQVETDMVYKGRVIKGQRLDLLVENELIVEVKSLTSLPQAATAQVLSYLKATGLKRGLILNFGEAKLIDGVKRISL